MYIVSYDITNDRRRRKVAKVMENYGRRVQYSVFECELDKHKYSQMYEELCQLMDLGDADTEAEVGTETEEMEAETEEWEDSSEDEEEDDIEEDGVEEDGIEEDGIEEDGVEEDGFEDDGIEGDETKEDDETGENDETRKDDETGEDEDSVNEGGPEAGAEDFDLLAAAAGKEYAELTLTTPYNIIDSFLPEEKERIPFLQHNTISKNTSKNVCKNISKIPNAAGSDNGSNAAPTVPNVASNVSSNAASNAVSEAVLDTSASSASNAVPGGRISNAVPVLTIAKGQRQANSANSIYSAMYSQDDTSLHSQVSEPSKLSKPSKSPKQPRQKKNHKQKKRKSRPEEGSIRIYSICKNCERKTVLIGTQHQGLLYDTDQTSGQQDGIIVIG